MLIRSGEEEKRKQKRYIWCKTLAWTVSIFIEFTSTHDFYILGDKRLPSTTDLLRRRVFPDSFIPPLARSLLSFVSLSFDADRDRPAEIAPCKGWRRGLAALLEEILIGLLRDAGFRRIESAGNSANNRVSFVNENRRIARSIVRALSRESRLSIGLISQRFFEGLQYIRMDVLDGWISSNFAADN